ncbi:MAG TPA: TraR/DksA C4-type zinc finger protein [Gemmatimonadaceae bacterium]|nr:TraR/DksA C4-type zinc finger protein [Gemmatimonadaceae bacterium]
MTTAHVLTTAQLRDLERELRSERARLERTMLAEGESERALSPSGVTLRAPANAEGGLAIALESRTLARHEALVDALRRLEAGTYGSCASCSDPIPYGRLLAMPEAARCVSCAGRA